MADTLFSDVTGTPIVATWLNDINDHVYKGKVLDTSNWINVKDPTYGAKGDGSTDDTTAIQNALTAATTGNTVFIPFTTSFYKLTNTLTVPDGVSVIGAGYNSVLQQTARNKNVFSLGNNCKITNLRMKGDGVNSNGTATWGFNNGVSIVSKQGSKVQDCWIHNFEYNGVYVDSCTNYEISDNYFWGQLYSINSGADIIVYSNIDGARGKIHNNFLFSNNSNAVYVNALGNDTDIVVTNNVAATLDPSTFLPVSSGALVRRHGFILGYVGGGGGRIVCSNNFVYNTRQTGVYWQGASSTTGSVLITDNYVRDAGVNALQPTLAAGIYIAAQGKADIVANNIIDGMPVTGFITAAGISVLPGNAGVAAENNTLIIGNSVYNSAGHGIYVGSNAQNVRIVNNTFTACTQAYIIVTPDGSFTGGGYMEIVGNRGFGLTQATFGIFADVQVSAIKFTISDNNMNGFNNSTATTSNSGIFIRNFTTNMQITNNRIDTFYSGVGSDNYCNTRCGTRFIGNKFTNCNTAYGIGFSTGGTLITEQDLLVSTTNYQSPSLLAGNRVVYPGFVSFDGSATILFNAAPTNGPWLRGDRVQQSVPTVGQPKGWLCTAAGSPGTWVSEGNL